MIKPDIHFIDPSSKRKICSFAFETPMLKNLKARIRKTNDGTHEFITEIKNPQNKILGSESFSLYENDTDISGLNIVVNPEYRGKHKLGEILRLISIIEIIENNIKNFKIFSKDTAVFFHSKYKFLPNITQFGERDTALKDIITNATSQTQDNAKLAKELLMKSARSKLPSEQREFCKQANVIVADYIKKIISLGASEYKKYPFTRGMDMVLTNDELVKNRDFFNKLFANHGIDYKI